MSGSQHAFQAALAQLTSDDAMTREDGLLALEELDLRAASAALCAALEAMARDARELPPLRATAAWRLHDAGRPLGLSLLEGFLRGDEPPLRWRSVGILGQLAAELPRALELVREALELPDPRARLHAASVLSSLGQAVDATAAVLAALERDDEELQVEALQLASGLPPSPELLAALQSCAAAPSEAVRSFAMMTLMMLGAEAPEDQEPDELAATFAQVLRVREPDYDPQGSDPVFGPQRWLHPQGRMVLTLPPGWVRFKHDPALGLHQFRPLAGVGDMSLQTLGVGGPAGPGRSAAVLEQLLPALGALEHGALTVLGDEADELAWCDAVTAGEDGAPRPGRLWLRLRGDEAIFASYDAAAERRAEAAPELELAHGAVRSLEVLEPGDDEDLAELVVAAMRRAVPAEAARCEDGEAVLNGGELDLSALEEWCEAHPGFTSALAARWAREVVALRRPRREALPLEEVRHRLRPVLRPDVFFEEMGPSLRLARRELTPKVWVTYVLDDAFDRPYVREEWLAAWGLDPEQLHGLAVAGLEACSDVALELAEDEGRVNAVQCSDEDGYTTARLLVPSFARRVAEQLGEASFVALIPREDLLVALREPPAEALPALVQTALGLTVRGPFPVSYALLRCTVDGAAVRVEALEA